SPHKQKMHQTSSDMRIASKVRQRRENWQVSNYSLDAPRANRPSIHTSLVPFVAWRFALPDGRGSTAVAVNGRNPGSARSAGSIRRTICPTYADGSSSFDGGRPE